MSDLKTLAEIWEESDRRPVKVASNDKDNQYLLVGIKNENAFLTTCSFLLAKSDLRLTSSRDRRWQVYQEPKKLVEHWPAVILDNGHPKPKLMVDPYIYRSEQEAKDYYRICHATFIRLATEYPAIMLEVDDE